MKNTGSDSTELRVWSLKILRHLHEDKLGRNASAMRDFAKAALVLSGEEKKCSYVKGSSELTILNNSADNYLLSMGDGKNERAFEVREGDVYEIEKGSEKKLDTRQVGEICDLLNGYIEVIYKSFFVDRPRRKYVRSLCLALHDKAANAESVGILESVQESVKLLKPQLEEYFPGYADALVQASSSGGDPSEPYVSIAKVKESFPDIFEKQV